MKIKIQRQSGLPVEIEHLELYQKDFKEYYDGLYDKMDMSKVLTMSNKNDEQISKDSETTKRFQNMINDYEKALIKKYPNIVEIDFIKTKKGFKSLVNKFRAGILVTFDENMKNMVYVILDSPF